MRLWELFDDTRQLDELLNQAAEWSWRTKSTREWAANFTTGDNTFWVYLDGHDDDQVILTFIDDERSDEITGRGNSFKVFATVAEITRDFLKRRHPRMLTFSANETSRAKLYGRLAQSLADETGGRVTTGNQGGTHVFRIVFDREDHDDLHEEGKIIPGVNTTVDVQPGETNRQAIKFGNKLDAEGRPPLLRGSYGDDSARFSANQGDPFYGPDGTTLRGERR